MLPSFLYGCKCHLLGGSLFEINLKEYRNRVFFGEEPFTYSGCDSKLGE